MSRLPNHTSIAMTFLGMQFLHLSMDVAKPVADITQDRSAATLTPASMTAEPHFAVVPMSLTAHTVLVSHVCQLRLHHAGPTHTESILQARSRFLQPAGRWIEATPSSTASVSTGDAVAMAAKVMAIMLKICMVFGWGVSSFGGRLSWKEESE